jgi:YegS/Rv2252/BmrU family lipid kinase
MKKYSLENLEADFNPILIKYGYAGSFFKSKYKGSVTDIVQSLDDDVDLVISIGGDGTLNESSKGNFNRDKKLVLGHLPTGTTNDVGKMYGFGKDLLKNLEILLSGEVKNVDICTLNGEPFVYVAGFGKFLNVPYETSRKSKKAYGYLAYINTGFKEFFNRPKFYNLSYEVDGKTYSGTYSMMITTNATRIAGFQNVFNDIKIDDGLFEVLFCDIKNKKDLVKSLLYLPTTDISNIPGFYYHKTSKIIIHNKKNKKIIWDVDGEKKEIKTDKIEIRVEKIKIMVPAANLDNLFAH